MTTDLPLVSICIPTYNAAEFFEPCLQSAIAQTYPNIEILISDDGSTDDTINMVKKYQQSHSSIRLIKGPSTGMVNNWNHCIEQASGEWIKFLFQDDILMPHCIEKMLSTCIKHQVEVGLCRRNFIIHDEVPRHIRHNFRYTMVLPERVFEDAVYISPERLAKEMAELLPLNVLGEPTSYLFHKKIIEHTGKFNADYNHLVDLEFILRIGLFDGFVFLAEPLALFRVHGKSQTSANLNEEKETIIRNIAALTGDNILLYHDILHKPCFDLVKEAMKADVLQLNIDYLYYSGCRHKGKKIFNEALAPIRKKYKALGQMQYSFFKYAHYRKQYKNWVNQSRQ